MTLSVCIPVYNFDVRPLVLSLSKEIELKNLDVEILILDDASNENFKPIHKDLKVNLYLEMHENQGRARIRNHFSRFAKGKYLLFLDGDGDTKDIDFLEKWLKNLGDVVYGGRETPENISSTLQSLRWTYARKRENLSLEIRSNNPYLCFQTNNFLIEKNIFKRFPFDENFNGYGYEDSLFALNLKKAGIPITHIQNPIFNRDIETNPVFIEKSKQAAHSLAIMLKSKAPVNEIKLAQTALFLKKIKLNNLFLFLFYLIKNSIRKKLNTPNASLFWLDIWKLGWTLHYISASSP